MIASVIKAIEILEIFTPEKPTLSLAEISSQLGYPKTTLHTILRTLESKILIEKGPNGSYSLGLAIIPMTQSVRVNVQLRDRAAPLLRELGDFCRESVYLTVLDRTKCLYIYAIESPDRLLARTAVGERVKLHCTSVGKAILSFLPFKLVQDMVPQDDMQRFNERTLTNHEVLQKELIASRTQGYSIDDAEHEDGTYCIGAPIFNENGDVFASCSIAGSDPQILGDKLGSFSSGVRFTAQEISRRMGFVPSGEKLIWKEIANPIRDRIKTL